MTIYEQSENTIIAAIEASLINKKIEVKARLIADNRAITLPQNAGQLFVSYSGSPGNSAPSLLGNKQTQLRPVTITCTLYLRDAKRSELYDVIDGVINAVSGIPLDDQDGYLYCVSDTPIVLEDERFTGVLGHEIIFAGTVSLKTTIK